MNNNEEMIRVFKENDIDKIKQMVLQFAENITKEILLDNNENINKLLKDSCMIRDNIELDKDIERNKDFFFGYLYAIENIGTRIQDNKEIIKNIDSFINSNDNIPTIINYITKNQACIEETLLKDLNIDKDEFKSILLSESEHNIDMFTMNIIAKKRIVSLSSFTRKYIQNNKDWNNKKTIETSKNRGE